MSEGKQLSCVMYVYVEVSHCFCTQSWGCVAQWLHSVVLQKTETEQWTVLCGIISARNGPKATAGSGVAQVETFCTQPGKVLLAQRTFGLVRMSNMIFYNWHAWPLSLISMVSQLNVVTYPVWNGSHWNDAITFQVKLFSLSFLLSLVEIIGILGTSCLLIFFFSPPKNLLTAYRINVLHDHFSDGYSHHQVCPSPIYLTGSYLGQRWFLGMHVCSIWHNCGLYCGYLLTWPPLPFYLRLTLRTGHLYSLQLVETGKRSYPHVVPRSRFLRTKVPLDSHDRKASSYFPRISRTIFLTTFWDGWVDPLFLSLGNWKYWCPISCIQDSRWLP